MGEALHPACGRCRLSCPFQTCGQSSVNKLRVPVTHYLGPAASHGVAAVVTMTRREMSLKKEAQLLEFFSLDTARTAQPGIPDGTSIENLSEAETHSKVIHCTICLLEVDQYDFFYCWA